MDDKDDIVRRTVHKIVADAGFACYDYHGQHARSLGDAAERQTQGRTHYFDKGTRRSFGSRVLKLETFCHGVVLGCIESVTPPHGQKIYRPVFFDFLGECIERKRADEAFATYQAARKAYQDYAATLDWAAIVQAALAREQARLQRRLGDITYAQSLLVSARSKAE